MTNNEKRIFLATSGKEWNIYLQPHQANLKVLSNQNRVGSVALSAERIWHISETKGRLEFLCCFYGKTFFIGLPFFRIKPQVPHRKTHNFLNYFKKGVFFMYDIHHCFICRPSDSTVSEDVGIDTRKVAITTLAVRRSNHSARSNPHSA